MFTEVDEPKNEDFWLGGVWSNETRSDLRDLCDILNNMHNQANASDIADLLLNLSDYEYAKAKLESYGIATSGELYPLSGHAEYPNRGL